jgi:hypothetical protein
MRGNKKSHNPENIALTLRFRNKALLSRYGKAYR